jgi:hypothetical protein
VTVFQETKIAIIIGPEAKPASSLEGAVSAPSGLDPSDLRRTLLHTGCTAHDRMGSPAAGHPHHDPHAGPSASTSSNTAQRHPNHSHDVSHVHGGAPERDSHKPHGTRSESAPELPAREITEGSKDLQNGKELPIRRESSDSALDKPETSRDRRGAPHSSTDQDNKLGVERRTEPTMPERSTPIGDLLKPDTLRELIRSQFSNPNSPNTLMSDGLAPRYTTNRSQENHQAYDQRTETQRVVQQVQIQETLTARTVIPDASSWEGRTQAASASTATTLNDLRTSTLDKLHQMKSALEIAMERAQPHLSAEHSPPSTLHSQPPGAFSYVEPVRHNTTPMLTVHNEDRSNPGRSDAAARSEKANLLFDSLAAIAKKVASVETLRKLDQSFESACLAMFAAAALGVMATDRLLRELLALARETEQRLKEEGDAVVTERDAIKRLHEAAQSLEEELQGTQANQAGLVADITGIVADATLGRPVAGVRIDAGPLGTIETNNWGEFHLRNIPIGTAYQLVPSHIGYSFTQEVISGTVGATNYIHIDALRQLEHPASEHR